MARNNVWMSVSDLMTGLMIIFLFIAIAYIKRVQNNQSVLNEYVENRSVLHDKLAEEFRKESNEGQMTIKGDLSMRFENAETLFPSGSSSLSPAYKAILSDVMPRYLTILLNDTMRDKIREIRIEGHTDDTPAPGYHSDPYLANVILSQKRALSVLAFIRELPAYKGYSEQEQRLLEYWFTANGLSYGRALDADGTFALISGNPISKEDSRRVEIRIVTSGDEVLENFVIQNNKISD